MLDLSHSAITRQQLLWNILDDKERIRCAAFIEYFGDNKQKKDMKHYWQKLSILEVPIEKILSYKGLSVFLESDGLLVNEELCNKLAKIEKSASERTNGWHTRYIAFSVL